MPDSYFSFSFQVELLIIIRVFSFTWMFIRKYYGRATVLPVFYKGACYRFLTIPFLFLALECSGFHVLHECLLI